MYYTFVYEIKENLCTTSVIIGAHERHQALKCVQCSDHSRSGALVSARERSRAFKGVIIGAHERQEALISVQCSNRKRSVQ